jgi:bis(5'-nucleosyl)-tetraphosphatase (symmetrical)
VLRGDAHVEYFRHMYGNKPELWNPALSGMERWRFITNALTRLRYCTLDGRMALKEKGRPGSQAAGRLPWFEHPDRASRALRVVFGHWSTLGYLAAHNVWAIDTGCLWGGSLTLLRLDTSPPRPATIPCARWQDPTAFA